MNIVYLTFGDNIKYHLQAYFSIRSIQRYITEEDKILVLSTNPSFYKRCDINVIPLSEELVKSWEGDFSYPFRIKVKGLEYIQQQYPDDHILFVDTDTFAYITGRLVGRHKLCPNISPNKTIEGFIGGTLMGVVVATSFYHVFINSSISLSILILVTMTLSIVGQLGDLVFSMIKRYYDKKDFSNLIPGHGGILDRFDSLIFIALAFILVSGII